MNRTFLLVFYFFLFFMVGHSQEEPTPVEFVDPFIGTEGEGNTFSGATLPFGMVKLGPDCGEKTSNSGYRAGADIHGFSHTHVSGTGGGPKYGNVLMMPFSGDFDYGEASSPTREQIATPGYYEVNLSKYN
ncbi:MAG: glycoside hydrolase family 92 protein, partial [Bacteroidota bacterium]